MNYLRSPIASYERIDYIEINIVNKSQLAAANSSYNFEVTGRMCAYEQRLEQRQLFPRSLVILFELKEDVMYHVIKLIIDMHS